MSRWPGKYVIGLTGNIATGKSLIRKMLEHLGAFGIDADGLSAMAMSPGAPAFQPVVDTFGNWIVGEDDKINRESLGRVVFSDPGALSKLEAIVHPIVSQAINTLAGRAKQDVIIIEAIKLLESDLGGYCDAVWVVDAPETVQLARLTQKRGMSDLDAMQRMAAQSAQDEKLNKADVVINNSGSFDIPWNQIQVEWAKITGAPAPAPIAIEPTAAPDAVEVDVADINLDILSILRGGPGEAEAIAAFINQQSKKAESINRMDVMLSFGEKAYLAAMSGETMVGLVGFQVENLITSVDELYLRSDLPVPQILALLIEHMEKASADLQSEVSLVFVPDMVSTDFTQAIVDAGYEPRMAEDLEVMIWRDAAANLQPESTMMLAKRLREGPHT